MGIYDALIPLDNLTNIWPELSRSLQYCVKSNADRSFVFIQINELGHFKEPVIQNCHRFDRVPNLIVNS